MKEWRKITLNEGKYFSLGIFQNYLVSMPSIKYIKCFHATIRIQNVRRKY